MAYRDGLTPTLGDPVLLVGQVRKITGTGLLVVCGPNSTDKLRVIDSACVKIDEIAWGLTFNQVVPYVVGGQDAGGGLTIVASQPDGIHTSLAPQVWPNTLRVVRIAVNIWHDTGTDPGPWDVIVNNDDGAAAAILENCSMANWGWNDNITVGSPAVEVPFGPGERMRVWLQPHGGSGAADNVIFRAAVFLKVLE